MSEHPFAGRHMRHNSNSLRLTALILASISGATAQSTVPSAAIVETAASEFEENQQTGPTSPVDESTLAGSFGIDFPTKYYFRGFLQEDQGVIAQPWLDLGYTLHESNGALQAVNLNFGTWNSLHDGPTGSGGPNSMWYESDFYATLSVSFLTHWHADLLYVAYTSPNSTFATAEEIDLSLSFDDSHLWGDAFGGLQPSVVLGWEVVGQADSGGSRGSYVQVGIEPGVTIFERGEFSITGSMPVTAGFSLDNYYEDAAGKDQTFGFLDLGLALSAPVTFVPSRFGGWTATLGIHYLSLGETPKAINGGDDNVLIASFGLSTTF